jgi:hypothetical protein
MDKFRNKLSCQFFLNAVPTTPASQKIVITKQETILDTIL